MPSDRKRFGWFIAGIATLLIVSVYLHLTSGSYELTLMETLKTLFRLEENTRFDLVVFEFRLPRIVIGAIVGFGLGLAGAILQGITRNPLADPGIIGINAGAGAAVVCFMFFFQGQLSAVSWLSILAMPLFAWCGGLLAIAFILAFAMEKGRLDPQTFILTGIAVSAGFGALTLFFSLKMNPRDYEMAAVWLAGSIYSANWKHVVTVLPWIFLLTPAALYKARVLDVLGLADTSIKGLGVDLAKERRLLILLSVGLVSACVSVAGSMTFVGLLSPHIARRLVGVHHRFLLPSSGLIGMGIVVAADWLAKTMFAPAQLPVGIVISIIGVPYFVFLLFQTQKAR